MGSKNCLNISWLDFERSCGANLDTLRRPSKLKFMDDTKPYPLTPAEWEEFMKMPEIRESWGLDNDTTVEDFANEVYAAKFNFVSGSPGYVGDLFILQGSYLTGDAPFVLRRDEKGKLIFVE